MCTRGRGRWRGCGLLASAALLLAGAGAAYYARTWPDVAALAGAAPRTTAFMQRHHDHHGRDPEWTWVAYGRISPHLKRAVLVGEDLGFFAHRGFDVHEIRAALAEAWRERSRPRGASTITQQLAKNLWLSPSANPVRKLREAILAAQLESHLTKRRILELYLNVAEFGPGVYGAEAAARRFFAKPASDLSPVEAAQLAAGLPRPSRWHPGSPSRAYARRVQRLLLRMEQARFLDRLI